MTIVRQTLNIAAKDLRAEFRSKESINASLSFSVVILLIFSFAFEPTSELTREISGGLLWIVFAFAGALILNRSFARELPNDCLDALVASPVSGAAMFLGKSLANMLMLIVVESVSLPVFGIFYNVTWTHHFWQLVGVVLLATWGITVVGTMFSALTVNLRLREIMLPMLTYPIMIPGLLGAIQLTTALIAGQAIGGDNYQWLKLLIGFDVIYTLLAVALVDIVLMG